MLVAVSAWQDRIAPVFDVARGVRLYAADADGLRWLEDLDVRGREPAEKVAALANRGVVVLLCGAIARSTELMARARGVEVVSFVTGPLDEVLAAWRDGKLIGNAALVMPGCGTGGERRRHRRTRR